MSGAPATGHPAAGAHHHQLIRPGSRLRGPELGELWHFRSLLRAMTRRDLTLRYRQTMLGPIWIVLQPLLGAGIFAFVFGSVAGFKSDGVPYFVFSYAGMLAWNPFANTVFSLTNCLVNNMNLVSKIYFPRMLLPLAQIGSKLADFAIGLGLFFVIAAAYGVDFTPRLLAVPAWMLLAFALALGPGLVLAALNVSYRDTGYVVPVVLPLLMYLCPIAYGTSQIPAHFRGVYRLNPVVGLVDGFRWSLLGRAGLDAGETLYSLAVAACMLVVGVVYFRSRERRFADEI